MDAQPTNAVIDELSRVMPPVMRWSGALARSLRQFDVSLEGKSSGNANTDALTLADLTVQELLVGAMRDADRILRTCRIEAEEVTGDLQVFADESPLVVSLDPIDGTKQFRDHTGDGYAVMLHLRNRETVLYSLVYLPEATHAESGTQGEWVEVRADRVRCGPDDTSRPAGEVLASLPPCNDRRRTDSRSIYLIGFQKRDGARAQAVTNAGLEGFAPDAMPGSIYPLMATGDVCRVAYSFPQRLRFSRVAAHCPDLRRRCRLGA